MVIGCGTISKAIGQSFRWALCLIFAGALGNIIDSVFYGIIFSHSYGQVATLFPEGGYAHLSRPCGGHVAISSCELELARLDAWRGEQYTFFQYVFNIADTAISIGAGIIIVFNKTIFGQEIKKSSSQKA